MKRNLMALSLFCLRFKWGALCLILTLGLYFILLTNNSRVPIKSKHSVDPVFKEPLVTAGKYNPHCTLDSCFDSSRCSKFKVYVYPDDQGSSNMSENFRKILSAIRRSPFYTTRPEDACLFVPSIDTLDRDPLSRAFDPNIQKLFNRLPFWISQPGATRQDSQRQPGMNHLLFILFPGTWPKYDVDDLRMDVGSAMLARASASKVFMRQGFDISFPLVTSNYPEAGQEPRYSPPPDARIHLNLLASFKGKRYVIGNGSETRNSLYHIHNGKDIIMATTCRHMKNWNLFADARCAADNAYYETVSYEELLHNSTFCLVPRGRRPGSFRFLEVLEAGCIPILLANDWELPFSEVIDWSQAAVLADERTLSRLPVLIRNIPGSRVVQMREKVRFIWNRYFRSVDAIVHTSLMLIRDRLIVHRNNYELWNSSPGRILFSESTDINGCMYPSPDLPTRCRSDIDKGFTLLVTIRQPFCSDYMKRLTKLATVFTRSPRLKRVILVWQCDFPMPPSEAKLSVGTFNNLPVKMSFAPPPKNGLNFGSETPSPSNRFRPTTRQISTVAVWSTELDVANTITLSQIEAAYAIWLQYPHKLVGFSPRTHVWSKVERAWTYSVTASSHGNFSMVLLNAAVYHRYYHTLYWKLTSPQMREIVDTMATGEDILFNCVVGYSSQSAPLLLTTTESTSSNLTLSELTNYMGTSKNEARGTLEVGPNDVLNYRHTCLRAFSNAFEPSHIPASFADPQSGKHFGLANSTKYPFLPLYYSNLRFVTSYTRA